MKRNSLLIALLITLVLPFSGAFVYAQESAATEGDTSIGGEKESQTGLAPEVYESDTLMQTGTIVQADPENPKKVKPATQDTLAKAFGIVISRNRLPIQFVETTSERQLYVSSSGRHDALVTSENGPIEAGDMLAVSSLSGTLAKSTTDQKIVFAKALESFDGKNNALGMTTLNDTEGRPVKQVGLGRIAVQIQIIANPDVVSTKADLPEQLQRLGKAIAEKEVSPIRIYLSMAIITLSIIIALAVLYSGIRSAVIAIGRNPLSKKSIFWALLQVILSSILVLIIGMFTVYLLLRL